MSTKVYLCARFGRRAELRGYRATLRVDGYHCTSRWLDDPEPDTDADRAAHCVADVLDADVLIAFSEAPAEYSIVPYAARGGRHVELGIAYGCGMPVIVVGERENVFHSLDEGIDLVPCWLDALAVLDAIRDSGGVP